MMPGRKTLAIVLVATLLLLVALFAAPATAASGEPGVHITKMTVEPNGTDFNLTVQYSTSFMTKFFSMLFGAKVVQPGVVDQLSVLGDVKLVSIDTAGQTAKLQAKNQSKLSGNYYFYDKGPEFPAKIDQLEIRGNAYDLPRTINDTTFIPMFFYKM
jgi:hypothetical protein